MSFHVYHHYMSKNFKLYFSVFNFGRVYFFRSVPAGILMGLDYFAEVFACLTDHWFFLLLIELFVFLLIEIFYLFTASIIFNRFNHKVLNLEDCKRETKVHYKYSRGMLIHCDRGNHNQLNNI